MTIEMEKPFLPFEIIINIITRLPIKSIAKFQSVCKQWKDLIKSQSFISQHTLHFAHQNPFLLIHAYDDNFTRHTLRLLDHNMQTTEVLNTHLIDSFTRGWTIVGSTKGLLCVELAAESGSSPISYLVWNPVSNEVKEIPQILHDYDNASRVGFGYSSVVNDYKIVRFYHHDLLGVNKCKHYPYESVDSVQGYSLSTGLWKTLEMRGLPRTKIFHQAVSVNGSIFWLGLRSDVFVLIAFDIATEVFTKTPINTFSTDMEKVEYSFCPTRMYGHGNKLAMCEGINLVRGNSENRGISMWVIEEGDNESGKSYSCTEKYRLPMSQGLGPLCIWRNQIVCGFDKRRYEGDERNYLHLFNISAKEWKKFPNFSGAYDCCAIFNYEKSLSACLCHLG